MNNTLLFSSQLPEASPAVSAEYAQIILRNQVILGLSEADPGRYFLQPVDTQYNILYLPLSDWYAAVDQLSYHTIPKLFTFLDTVSLESAGILSVQRQPYLNLQGSGVLVGFMDSGIDYRHPAFRKSDGRTRILGIWDQTASAGIPPEDFGYGAEYTEDQINAALFSSSPLEIVPQTDELGHGTAVAGIACGSPDPEADFIGAAPQSALAMVKLRSAPAYLRDYFIIPEEAIAFQETDLMLGVRYLTSLARRLGMPLIICITLGTNQGSHIGNSPLEDVLTAAQLIPGIYAVAGAGNEVGRGHHFQGSTRATENTMDIELLVDEETRGFTLEFWASTQKLYSIGFTSPFGDTIQPIQPRSQSPLEIPFLLESSRIRLTYYVTEILSGDQMIQIRFQDPSPGIWRIRVVSQTPTEGTFHLWLPITGLVDPFIRFYRPSADTTLVIPSCAEPLITCSTYNAYNNSLYIHSSRGFTRSGLIKPDFAAPGVNVTAPQTDLTADTFSYTPLTGACAAAALTAGAAALLVESGLLRQVPLYYTTRELKSLFLRGTRQNSIYTYPNREWGYGTMDIYRSFEVFLNP